MPKRDHYHSDLESEGVRDDVGPLPEKEMTGDGQEGIIPPGDQPRGAGSFGTTAAEQRAGESVEARRAQELPNRYAGRRRDPEVEQLVEPGSEEFDDVEDQLVGEEEPGDGMPSTRAAEEAAMHIVDEEE